MIHLCEYSGYYCALRAHFSARLIRWGTETTLNILRRKINV